MKKSLLLLLIGLTVHISYGQKIENAIFWEVSGNGLTTPSYLYGTIKFLPSKDYFLSKNVKNKLKASKIFATETLLDHHSLHELNKAAHLPHHQSVKDLLTAEDYDKLKDIFTKILHVSPLKFDMVYSQFKPVVLSTTMTRLSLGKNVRYYEIEMVKMARKNGILTLGLETASREIAAIESFDEESQVKALSHTIAHFDQQLAEYRELIEAYKVGDLHKTLQYALHPSEGNDTFREAFFDTRNAEWIPHMEKYMQESASFFALGAAHLADDKGIIKLLRARGYTVKPYPLK
jgi:uncharacterized protein YbaP (TraB family)